MSVAVKQELLQGILGLAKKYGIEKLYLFGSRARGDHKERSDIDLAVAGGNIVRFTLDLEELPSLLMFDVVDLCGAVDEAVLDSIRKEGVLLYEKTGEV